MCPHWLQGGTTGFLGEAFCQGLPPRLKLSQPGGHRARPLGARADDAAGEDDKRPELQVQVQERNPASVLVVTHPQKSGWEGKPVEPSLLSVCCAAENRGRSARAFVAGKVNRDRLQGHDAL